MVRLSQEKPEEVDRRSSGHFLPRVFGYRSHCCQRRVGRHGHACRRGPDVRAGRHVDDLRHWRCLGAHLNPAVTIGFWLARRFPGGAVIPYVASQLLGALLASGLMRAMFLSHANLGATEPAGPALQSLCWKPS